ncbi:hypothetical protein PACTADRAFT_4960 [Pachysolen tannophilus NRRL Y-2460]|uniref:SET domain-containing protein n=1 Tax=Pachysolen tannophilus NRRL Y-2460 TaxID=669874 RepID=A0A1E4TN40_PACTA|nr:hypothetical protein PACTADRAFT_4960 [Pachysolen tannophilus NRRL Y-2460]
MAGSVDRDFIPNENYTYHAKHDFPNNNEQLKHEIEEILKNYHPVSTKSKSSKNIFDLPISIKLKNENDDCETRGLAATRTMIAGTRFHSFSPTLNIPESYKYDTSINDYVNTICSVCKEKGGNPAENNYSQCFLDLKGIEEINNGSSSYFQQLFPCSQCNVPYYCSEICFAKDSFTHKYECYYYNLFKKRYGEIPTTMERMTVRLLFLSLCNDKIAKQMSLLTNHYEIIENYELFNSSPHEYKFQADQIIFHLESLLFDSFSSKLKAKVKSDIYTLFVNSTISLNCFQEANGQMFDSGIFALFNHSCEPNVACVFNGEKVDLYSTKPIAVGEELFVNYNLTYLPRLLRIKDLEYRFFFTCKCPRCKGQYDKMAVMKCPYCDSIIGDFNIAQIIEHDTNCYNVRNSSMPHVCKACNRNLEMSCHEIFESYRCLLISHLRTIDPHHNNQMKLNVNNQTENSLIFKMIDNNYNRINPISSEEEYSYLEKWFKEIRMSKMFSTFTYPLPEVLARLIEFNESALQDSFKNFKLIMIQLFEIDFLVEQGTFRVSYGNLLLEFLFEISNITTFLCKYDKESKKFVNYRSDLDAFFKPNIQELFIKTCFVISIHTLYGLLKCYPEKSHCVRVASRLTFVYKQSCYSGEGGLFPQLQNWYRKPLKDKNSMKSKMDQVLMDFSKEILNNLLNVDINMLGKFRFSDSHKGKVFNSDDIYNLDFFQHY